MASPFPFRFPRLRAGGPLLPAFVGIGCGALLVTPGGPARAAAPIAIKNAGFEDGLTGWTASGKGEKFTSVVPEAAAIGAAGLLVDDTDGNAANLVSDPIPAKEGAIYNVKFWGKLVEGKFGANVKLEYRDAQGKGLEPIKINRLWPGFAVKYKPGYESYLIGSQAPAGSASMVIRVTTFGSGTGRSYLDDLSLWDVSDGKPNAPDEATLLAEIKAGAARYKDRAAIIVKLDDLVPWHTSISPRWKKAVEYLGARKLKSNLGIIAKPVEGSHPEFEQWVKDQAAGGLVEYWHHGYDHAEWTVEGKKLQEFQGSGYAHQKENLTKAINIVQEKLGVTLKVFGAPFNSTDADTEKVIAEDPNIQVWLYAPSEGPATKTRLGRIFAVNIETPTFVPNYKEFLEGYAHNRDCKYFVLQGHPNAWGDDRFAEFAKIIDFLNAQGHPFVFGTDMIGKAAS